MARLHFKEIWSIKARNCPKTRNSKNLDLIVGILIMKHANVTNFQEIGTC